MKIDSNIRNLIKQALKEDIGKGDITTDALIPRGLQAKAVIIAKQSGVVAGMDIVKSVFTELDKEAKFKALVKDGDKVAVGKKIIEISGNARPILTAERTALNFLGHLSGVATLTRQFVDKVRPFKAKILDTRKTTPGMRALEKYAVRCGGGSNHRIGLYDGVLVKENHFLIFSKNKNIVKAVDIIRKSVPKNTKVEVEVENIDELKQALAAKVDIILLDNMTPGQIRHSVIERGKSRALLEASGRVNLSNVRRIAKSGVDRISIGALTHSAKSLDFSLDIA